MDPDVVANHVDAIEAAPVTATDSHVVGLAVGDGVHDEMEHGSVDEDDVVDREVVGLLETQETSTVALAVLVVLISKTCSIVLIVLLRPRTRFRVGNSP